MSRIHPFDPTAILHGRPRFTSRAECARLRPRSRHSLRLSLEPPITATVRFGALIADIVRSRSLEDRGRAQERFLEVLQDLNRRHGPLLASRFTITLGDECQALVYEPHRAVQLADELMRRLAPLRVRFSLGVGPLDTALDPDPRRTDGPCLHRARAAMERLKRSRRLWSVSGLGETWDPLLSDIGALSHAVRGRWTPRQLEIMEALDGVAYGKDAAARLGISPSVVSESMSSALRDEVRASDAALTGLIQRAIQTSPEPVQ